MTEQNFAQRLRALRRRKHLTQQELADILGVSNKSVSWWENGGGYPDITLLVPLARALEVTADDLLGSDPAPVPPAAGPKKSFLSFAAVMGGGAVFSLVDLLFPALVGYPLFLLFLAWGFRLQRRCPRPSRWFFPFAMAMDLLVNAQLLFPLVLRRPLAAFLSQHLLVFSAETSRFLGALLVLALAAAGLTGATWLLLRRRFRELFPTLRWVRTAMTPRQAAPLLCLPLHLLFFLFYALPLAGCGEKMDSILHILYRFQLDLFAGLTLLWAAVCLLLFFRRQRRWMLLPALTLTALSGTLLPLLARGLYYADRTISYRPGIVVLTAPDNTTLPLAAFSPAQLAAVLLLAAGYLALCVFRLRVFSPGDEAAPLSNITSL